MMRSSNRNIICVTGPLCAEFTGDRWIPRTKGQWRRTLMFPMICAWTNASVNNRNASDLIRHRTHYDVTVNVILVLIHDRCLRMYLYISMLFCQTLEHRHAVNICAQTASHSYFCLHRTNCATSFGQKSKFAWRSLWDADDLSTSDLREWRDENRCMFVVVYEGSCIIHLHGRL